MDNDDVHGVTVSREVCCQCDCETGNAGRYEDSLYAGDDGPYCEECWTDVPDRMSEAIAVLKADRIIHKRSISTLEADNERLRETAQGLIDNGQLTSFSKASVPSKYFVALSDELEQGN